MNWIVKTIRGGLTAGVLGTITLGCPQFAFAEAPSLYWHWAQGVKTSACKASAPRALRAELRQAPEAKGDNTWWAKNATATATVQCIPTGGGKSMAVMIVSSRNGFEAKALRNGLRDRITPTQHSATDRFDPDKAQ